MVGEAEVHVPFFKHSESRAHIACSEDIQSSELLLERAAHRVPADEGGRARLAEPPSILRVHQEVKLETVEDCAVLGSSDHGWLFCCSLGPRRCARHNCAFGRFQQPTSYQSRLDGRARASVAV